MSPAQTHRQRPTIACNDNGVFRPLRRDPAPADILAVALRVAAPICVEQVGNGVLIITPQLSADAPRRARRCLH